MITDSSVAPDTIIRTSFEQLTAIQVIQEYSLMEFCPFYDHEIV
jgi:hypothetical protein